MGSSPASWRLREGVDASVGVHEGPRAPLLLWSLPSDIRVGLRVCSSNAVEDPPEAVEYESWELRLL
jgi:hypothetical protein